MAKCANLSKMDKNQQIKFIFLSPDSSRILLLLKKKGAGKYVTHLPSLLDIDPRFLRKRKKAIRRLSECLYLIPNIYDLIDEEVFPKAYDLVEMELKTFKGTLQTLRILEGRSAEEVIDSWEKLVKEDRILIKGLDEGELLNRV